MRKTIVVILMFFFLLASTGWAFKLDLKNLLKDSLKYVAANEMIKQISGPLNDFVNTLLLNNGVENRELTKVVPILSVGVHKAIGLAQVTGPKELLDTVKAVFQLEGDFGGHNRFHIKALVPSTSSNPLKLDRVHGIGVTAVIEGQI